MSGDLHDPQDKSWWLDTGLRREIGFVQDVAQGIGLEAEINPAKQTNPYAPDLLVAGEEADLKCQTTPFFRAEGFYGIPVQYAVTFNRIDYERYRSQHPGIDIIWWIHWDQLSMTFRSGEVITTQGLSGVWRVPFSVLGGQIADGRWQLHEYINRRGDTRGNARDSYVLDLREFEQLTGDGWSGPSPSCFD